MTKTQFNKAGRRIWFSPSEDGGGTYRPVTRAGWYAFVLTGLWLLACAIGCMVALALTWDARWIGTMFAIGAVGLAAFAGSVIRHS